MFFYTSPYESTILLLYVGDMIITRDVSNFSQSMKTLLDQQFEMKDQEPLYYFLSIEVAYGPHGYLLS